MLIIKVQPNKPIEQALKKFKRKFLLTGVIKELRERSAHEKKSSKKRKQKQKAVYKHKMIDNLDN